MSKSRAMFAQKNYRKAIEVAMRNGDLTRAELYEKKHNDLVEITGVMVSRYEYVEGWL